MLIVTIAMVHTCMMLPLQIGEDRALDNLGKVSWKM